MQGGSIGNWYTNIAVDDVVAALKDLGEVQARADRAAETVRWRRDELRRIARGIDNALKNEDARTGV